MIHPYNYVTAKKPSPLLKGKLRVHGGVKIPHLLHELAKESSRLKC
jgi:hypothetical protein